jgi:hypothetical protein
MLHLQSSDTKGLDVVLDSYGAATTNLVIGRSANGTAASPTATATDDMLLAITGRGYQATSGPAFTTVNNAAIFFRASAGFTNVSQPTYITFRTTPAGSTTPAERLRITDAGGININGTITAGGTTGAQTINKPSGSVNFAAAATSLVVTNSLVTTSSVILCTVATNDATMKTVLCVAAAGSFTIFANAAATAETRVNFLVLGVS